MGEKRSREAVAAKAGERLMAEGAQLGFFGDDGQPIAPMDVRRGPGRPVGAGNKAKGKIKDWLAAKGYRDPAEQLAMLAGLDQRELHPLAYAAQVAMATGVPVDVVAREMRQAAAELMPYWHAKLTPDVQVNLPPVPILMQIGGAVTDDPVALSAHPFAPANIRAGITVDHEQIQGLRQGDANGGEAE